MKQNEKEKPSQKTEHINKIRRALSLSGFESEVEHKFLENRKFRFDIIVRAIRGINLLNKIKIAIEYEGGIYVQGRHTRPKGYIKDCEKYNLAVLNGWKVLRYTSDTLKKKNGEFLIAIDIENLLKAEGII